MVDSHFGMVKELKSLFYAFVFQLCSKSCSRSFCSTFLQQLNFDILISWIRSFFASVFRKTNFHEYIRRILNQLSSLSSQISSYLNNRNLKIALSSRKYPILNTSLIYASTRFVNFKKEKALL